MWILTMFLNLNRIVSTELLILLDLEQQELLASNTFRAILKESTSPC